MKQVNLNFKWVPEFYFIMVSILWFYLSFKDSSDNPGQLVNFPAILLIVLFHIQLFLDDKVLGTFLAILAASASLYLLFSLVSTLYTNYTFDHQAKIYALQGGNLILLNFIMAYLMYSKYIGRKTEESELI